MADTDELIRRLLSTEGVTITGLILNRRGLERAVETGIRDIGMGVSASDAHSRRNVNQPTAEALADVTALISDSKNAGLNVRGSVMCAFGCVYEGAVPEERVLSIVEDLAKAGADRVSLADTTGMANPEQVHRLVRKTRELLPGIGISVHLHDTRGLGLVNMLAAYEEGVREFDVCSGGLGGCPFVKGAAGNVSTEDSVNMFEAIGVKTGIDIEKLCRVVDVLESLLERPMPGKMNRVIKAALALDVLPDD
jgi:hydroxymethylglutaryl-CoA lyase